jgi:hypothetical protein
MAHFEADIEVHHTEQEGNGSLTWVLAQRTECINVSHRERYVWHSNNSAAIR